MLYQKMLGLICLLPILAIAQTNLDQEKLSTIKKLSQSLVKQKEELKVKQKNLEDSPKESKEFILKEKELKTLNQRYQAKQLQLITLITDIELDEIQADVVEKKRDFMVELQEIMGPLFDSFQRLSAKPRKIENLKNLIARKQEELEKTTQALTHLKHVKASHEFQTLMGDLSPLILEAESNIVHVQEELHLKKEKLESKLEELTKEDKSLFDFTTEVIKNFLSTKGKNLTLSFFVFVFVWWSLSKFKEKILARFLEHRHEEWFVKPINAFYGFMVLSLSLGLSLTTLYLLGDWVLVTVVILLISALLWTSKDYLPKYVNEFKFILNFGTVKEGELIIYEGLPWKVKSLGFMTLLENEFLDSQIIRVQLARIIPLHSRKILSREKWFPTKTGDYVILSDNTYGQVVTQTLEQITLKIKNTELKFYPTSEYLKLNPTNLSDGFSVEVMLNLDYKHQDKILDLVPELKNYLVERLKSAKNIICDFHSIGADSLNLYVKVDFAGEKAALRLAFERELQSSLLLFATKNELSLPFKQLTIHQGA